MSSFPAPNATLGATEIGSVVGAFLFGIVTLQTYNYYRKFPGDSALLKTTVALAAGIGAYDISVARLTLYGEPQYIASPPLSEVMTILFATLLYLIVQTFFANRVRILSGHWLTMVIASCLSLLRFIANMGSVGLLFHYRRVTILHEWPGQWLVTTALALGLAVDILITASMCYYLQRLRSCDSKRLQNMIESLILWSIGEESAHHAHGIRS
ncbi:hypothetical protein GGX14DRAFT_562998 [Mycena pura]|uniref:DUF6534 domain-containing protein n=1 Tax=Mycena pura TaxID=153505 RepID=A0AAD6VJL3_9AGAR|nr:hypothetical protein GGX14DRAFT_562998 [Mycena pura]